MPGTNLTREEAQARAASWTSTPTPSTSTSPSRDNDFGSTTVIRFSLPRARGLDVRRPGRRDDPRDHAERQDARRVRRSTPTTGSASTTSQADNELRVVADCPTATPARACTASSTRSTTGSTSTRSSRCPTPAASSRRSSSPTSRRSFTFHVTAPDALEGRLQLPDPGARPVPADGRRARRSWQLPRPPADVDVHHRARRRRVPRGPRHLRRRARRRSRSATTAGSRWCEHLDADELFEVTKQGFAFFEDAFDYPVPVRQVRPALRARVQHGRDGERRLRDVPRRVPPPQPAGARVLREPRQHDPARDGAHVVRRPRHDEVVGRPLAQRVVRRVGLAPRDRSRPPQYTEAWTGFTNARKNWAYRQDQLPSTHPIAADNYDLRGRRGQLRRHHLRQGRLGAQAARRVGRRGASSSPGCAPTSSEHAFGNSEFTDLLAALEEASGRELDAWAKEWLQTCGVNTLAPAFEVDDDGRFTSFAVEQTAQPGLPDAAPAPHRHRPLRPRRDGRLVRRTHGRDRRRRASTDVAELVGATQPDLVLLNDGDLTYAKIRLDERSLATVRRRASTGSTTRSPGRCAGAPPGT